jgi:hypothetical protein
LAADGSWQGAEFLVDIAADRTVFSAEILIALGFEPISATYYLGGVGGQAASVILQTQIRLTREQGGEVLFRGRYAAFTEVAALEMSVLGRDITNIFAVIADRPGDVVCLLGHRHRYQIVFS